jgi:hypothetical protein
LWSRPSCQYVACHRPLARLRTEPKRRRRTLVVFAPDLSAPLIARRFWRRRYGRCRRHGRCPGESTPRYGVAGSVCRGAFVLHPPGPALLDAPSRDRSGPCFPLPHLS